MVAARTPISDEELAKHRTREDIWIALHGNVYDVTDFIEEVSSLGLSPTAATHPHDYSILGAQRCCWNRPVPQRGRAQPRRCVSYGLSCPGMDASVAFDDIGHSDHARDLLKNFFLAPLASPKAQNAEKKPDSIRALSPPSNSGLWNSKW